jgi:hypothetical protein
MAQDVTDLAVVDPFAHSGDEGGRQADLFEIGESHCMSAP